MNKNQCFNCIWAKGVGSVVNPLECHYNAPRIISGSGTGWSDQNWPKVKTDDYCSKWCHSDSAEKKAQP